MKKIAFLLLFLMLFSFLKAQETRDVLYLSNGSIIRGTIVQNNDTIVRIRTYGDNVLAYTPDQIQGISNEIVPQKEISIKKSGYFFFTTMGLLVGKSDNEKAAPFSAMIEHSYKCKQKYAIGFILGYEQLKENTMPIGASLRYMIPAGKSSIVLGVSMGYAYPVEKPSEEFIKKATGGLINNYEIGILIPVDEGSAVYAAVGYRYSTLNYELEDWWLGDFQRKIKFNRISVRMGISIF